MMTNRVISGLLRIAGYLIPLIQSLPPLGIWTGLMTLPFASYLIIMASNLSFYLPRALSEFFHPLLVIEKTFVLGGFIILVYSIVFLMTKKKNGLVTSGPYRLVRHPQYLGMILSTLGFTSWSIWILKNTFGIGFLSPLHTIGVWFIELFAYVFFAYLEDLYLYEKYGESFKNYRGQVPFFIPFLKTNRDYLDILISIIIPAILLFGLIGFSTGIIV